MITTTQNELSHTKGTGRPFLEWQLNDFVWLVKYAEIQHKYSNISIPLNASNSDPVAANN